MRKKELVTFYNMCMVYDDKGNVLVQNRVKGWAGNTFPGGHVEYGESFTHSVIREVLEETGLTITSPRLCGVKDWMDDDGRSVVYCYKTNHFRGTLTSCEEGEMSWMTLEVFLQSKLASNMDKMVRVFLEDDISEHYFFEKDGQFHEIIH